MTSTEWLAYFRQNRRDRFPIAWEAGGAVDAQWAAALAHGLARWPRNRRRVPAIRDSDDAAAYELFVAEQAAHAQLLARVLKLLSQETERRPDRSLVLPWPAEVAWQLVNGVMGLRFFGTIRRGVRHPTIEAVCDQILHDEKFHVRFHCESLHRALTGRKLRRGLFCYLLTVGFAAASAAVACASRRALQAVGSSSPEFLAGAWRNFRAARDAVYFGHPFTLDATDQTLAVKGIGAWKALRP